MCTTLHARRLRACTAGDPGDIIHHSSWTEAWTAAGTRTSQTRRLTPSGSYKETGTELFVGCLNGTTCGQFTTTYTFTGKFTANFEAEIHGRCQHPVTGTSGGFAGRSGVIQFKDDVETGIFYYRGNIKS